VALDEVSLAVGEGKFRVRPETYLAVVLAVQNCLDIFMDEGQDSS